MQAKASVRETSKSDAHAAHIFGCDRSQFRRLRTRSCHAGLPIDDLFQQFEAEPVASGTIGQIHRAALGPRGARNTGCPEGACVRLDAMNDSLCFS